MTELQNATALTHAQVAQLLEPKREMLQDMDATQQAYASWRSPLAVVRPLTRDRFNPAGAVSVAQAAAPDAHLRGADEPLQERGQRQGGARVRARLKL